MREEKIYDILAGLAIGLIPLMLIQMFSTFIGVEIEMNTLHIGIFIITYLFSSFLSILVLVTKDSQSKSCAKEERK
jgi:hypothetical protein